MRTRKDRIQSELILTALHVFLIALCWGSTLPVFFLGIMLGMDLAFLAQALDLPKDS